MKMERERGGGKNKYIEGERWRERERFLDSCGFSQWGRVRKREERKKQWREKGRGDYFSKNKIKEKKYEI